MCALTRSRERIEVAGEKGQEGSVVPQSNMGISGKKKHAVVLPLCLQGHFFNSYRLAIELAHRGVTITFVGLEKEIALLRNSEELAGLDFNLISYKDVGTEHLFNSLGDPMLDLMQFVPLSWPLFEPIFDKLAADGKAGIPGPTCIVGDWILSWAFDAAKRLNIPYYQAFSSGAIYPRELLARCALFEDGTLSLQSTPGPGGVKFLTEFEGYINIPGLPPLQYRDMCNSPVEDVLGVQAKSDHKIGLVIREADAMIVNTAYELEAPQIDALKQALKELHPDKITKFFPVGPLPNAATMKNRSLVKLTDRGTECLQWLDKQSARSVVYFCIGTVAHFTPSQIQEIALALEASEQKFLWVASRTNEGALPLKFLERTKEQGLTISGWVPQLQILQHPAIGGFVTHCGWNSTIESITSGVPMATWPQIPNDQRLNNRYLVDVLKVAVEVISDSDPAPNSIPTKHLGVEKAVRLLCSKEGDVLRSRVQELQKTVAASVAVGGSSHTALNDLIESIPY